MEDMFIMQDLHEFIFSTLEELIDHVEELFFIDLIVEALQQLLNRSKVGLNLLLGVLVHAQLHLGALAAAHEALDLADVLEGLVSGVNIVHVVQISGEVLRHLITTVQNGEVTILEPGAGHLDQKDEKYLLEYLIKPRSSEHQPSWRPHQCCSWSQ